MPSRTRRVAEFVSRCRYGDLPDEVVDAARRILVDGVGVGIAGAATPELGPLLDRAGEVPGEVPTPAGKVATTTAAGLVGAAIHVLDYDDILPDMGHIGAVVVPVALSLGYTIDATDDQVLTAIAVGTEVGARLGASVNPGLYNAGWHPTSVLGTIAAAAAASSLLHLNVEQTAHALGLAVARASGTKASFGSLAKAIQVGDAAARGVDAGLLARSGATANDHALDPQFGGFYEMYAPGGDATLLSDGIGESYDLLRQGIRFKLLPCCGSIHAPVYALLDVLEKHPVSVGDIERIRAEVDPQRLPHTDRPKVSAGLEGKFSMQYCLAAAAETGGLVLTDFEDEAVRRRTRHSLMERVDLEATDFETRSTVATGSRSARVTVTTRTGESFEAFVDSPRGSKDKPVSWSDLESKFRSCAAARHPQPAVDDLVGLMRGSGWQARRLVDAVWAG